MSQSDELIKLELLMKSLELDLMKERFSFKSWYFWTLNLLSLFLGVIFCAIVGIQSASVIFFIMLAVIVCAAYFGIYTIFSPTVIVLYRDDLIIQEALGISWKSAESRGRLQAFLTSAQGGLSLKELYKLIQAERLARRLLP